MKLPGNRRGNPVSTQRVLRGGAWINNPENARSANRNRNNPDNRNNNRGFRVVCASHTPLVFQQTGMLRSPRSAECGETGGMARVCPVSMVVRHRAHTKPGRPLGGSPRGAFSLPAFYLLQPAAEQTADLRNHTADMLILAVIQPVPLMRQSQVETQAIECRIHPFKRILS